MPYTDKSCLGFMSQSLFGMNDDVPQQTIDSNLRKWPVMVLKHVNYNIGDLT